MSPSNSHGRGQDPQRPLRRATRAESTRARRARRSWRTRKVGTIFAVMPVVVVGFVGLAMASPFHRHHGGGSQNAGATACVSPAAGSGSANTTANTGPANTGNPANNGNSGNTMNSADPMASDTASSSTGMDSPSASASSSANGMVSGAGDHFGPVLRDHSSKHHNGGGYGYQSAAASASAQPTSAAGNGNASASPTATATCKPSSTAMAGAMPSKSATATAPAAPPPAATPNPNCTLVVPQNPLTAQGLATPYQFTATNKAMGPCNEANANQSAFVQAAIYDPATGAISVYDPLVIDMGTQPAAATVVPTLPNGAIVGIWFGFNATNLTLQDNNGSLNAGNCVNGMGNGDVFGQFAYCNAPAFFAGANAGIQAGMVKVPPLGTSTDGMPCLTLRDFGLIDQDQSDNVPSAYLANGNGQTAQKNAANMAALANATTIANPSDNGLLDNLVDPAVGCTPWTAPDLTNGNTPATALPLNELQAAALQQNPVALVPQNDPMVLVNAKMSAQKTDLYRMGVDQPALQAGQTPAQYCMDMDSIQSTRLQQDVNLLIGRPSPSAAAATNLFTFLGMRLQQSFTNLNCQNFGLTNPVKTLGMDGNGVVTSVTFLKPVAALTPGAGNPAANGAGAGNGGATQAPTTVPMPTATPTAVPSGNMKHHSGGHWRW